jgi:DNA-directed RNA polymerase subunit RPC12/RpoP
MPDAESEYFGESFDTDPPVPVGSPDVVANFATEDTAIPDDFVADEHVADVGDLTVMRAGVECPRCGSNVFLHPKSVYPPNTVYRRSRPSASGLDPEGEGRTLQ